MSIRSYLRKFKIRAKSLYFVILLTFLEVVLFLWWNNWVFTPAIIPAFIQLGFIIEKKEKWKTLSEEEKNKILISEETVVGFVKGIIELVGEGNDSDTIINKIKNG